MSVIVLVMHIPHFIAYILHLNNTDWFGIYIEKYVDQK